MINPSNNLQQNIDEKWAFVNPQTDHSPKVLPNFNEQIGPTFSVSSSPSPADFYNQMLPDSLFDHIVMCTNTRARIYFESTVPSSQHQEKWKPVRFFQDFSNNQNLCSEVSRDEIKTFFGIVVHMGMIRKKTISEYWSTDPYLITTIFHSSQYLSRNCFVFILW